MDISIFYFINEAFNFNDIILGNISDNRAIQGTKASGTISRQFVIAGGSGAIIGSVVSGVVTLFSVSHQNKHNFKLKTKERKHTLLANIMGHRHAATGIHNLSQNADPATFFSSLNSIGAVFSDSKEVMEAYQNYLASTVNENPNNTVFLYELVVQMHKNLNLESPSKAIFENPLVLTRNQNN